VARVAAPTDSISREPVFHLESNTRCSEMSSWGGRQALRRTVRRWAPPMRSKRQSILHASARHRERSTDWPPVPFEKCAVWSRDPPFFRTIQNISDAP